MIRKEIGLDKHTWRCFMLHRNHTKNKLDRNGHPVEFKLTFEQWCKVWSDSGKFDQRGCRRGQYVMSRRNDLGHYEEGNVFIQLHSENVRQGNARPKFKSICPHCGRPAAPHTMSRWHTGSCKEKT